MVYTKRKDLMVIELTEERNELSYDELVPLLIKRTSDVIYVELQGMLYGIVTMGRIGRTLSAETRQVAINKNFTAVPAEENTYMRSRCIFKEKDNVAFVPVVNAEGKLLGEWAKRNDLSAVNYITSVVNTPVITKLLQGMKITLIKSGSGFEVDRQLFLFWKRLFESKGALLTIIDFEDAERYIVENREVSIPIFINQSEAYSVFCRMNMAHVGDPSFGLFATRTCQQLLNLIGGNRNNGVETVLHSLKRQGVEVLAFDFVENERGFLAKFLSAIKERYRRQNLPLTERIYPSMRKDFLCERLEELDGVELPLKADVTLDKDCIHIWRDTDTPYLHVREGKRQTVGQPEKHKRCIYMVGPCIVAGQYVEDQYTIPSLLQKELNQEGFPVKVINLGMGGELSSVRLQITKVLREDLKQGDILVFDANSSLFQDIPTLNLTDEVEKNDIPVEWVAEYIRHCNHKANQIYAKAIYEKLFPVLCQPVKSRHSIVNETDVIKQMYIDRYFSSFDASKYGNIGSIVMNCNPFTLGHRYLIEYAAKQVSFLIIFVVEEDVSLFTFEERFAMVCNGTADLKNVKVVPSGDFILSKRSFPEYFIKETDEDIVKNTENDITLFAEKIAPVLGITHRFLGEEPEDPVTNIYNQAMKRILPAYGIQVIEIPRKKDKQTVISASLVRKCLEENDLSQLDTLVPESTKKALFLINE